MESPAVEAEGVGGNGRISCALALGAKAAVNASPWDRTAARAGIVFTGISRMSVDLVVRDRARLP
jgi:hypothetical protein